MTSWPPLPGGPQRSFALARREASGDTSFGHLRGHGNGQFVVSGQRDDLDPHRKALVQPQRDSGGGEFHGIPGGVVEQRPRDRKRLLIYGWKWLGRVFIHVHGVVSIQNLQILNSVPVDVALLCD